MTINPRHIALHGMCMSRHVSLAVCFASWQLVVQLIRVWSEFCPWKETRGVLLLAVLAYLASLGFPLPFSSSPHYSLKVLRRYSKLNKHVNFNVHLQQTCKDS